MEGVLISVALAAWLALTIGLLVLAMRSAFPGGDVVEEERMLNRSFARGDITPNEYLARLTALESAR